ncbi:flagellar hook-length control protein FliK [Agathobacter sp.]
MQISNLVKQYNSSVLNGEPMTGAKGVEKLVSSLSELSKGMIFEGTVNAVRGNQVRLALSNGQQITARLAGKFAFQQGQSVFFQVKSNDGYSVEIKPYTIDGEGANLTLMDALKAAGLPVDGANLSMVNKMMEEQMPIDKSSLNQMFQIAQDNPGINVTTLVELKKLGLDVTPENASQFENYMNDKQAVTSAMDSFFDELPNALSSEELSMYRLAAQSRDILSIVTDGLSEDVTAQEEYSDMSQYDALISDEGQTSVKTGFDVGELFESLNGTADSDMASLDMSSAVMGDRSAEEIAAENIVAGDELTAPETGNMPESVQGTSSEQSSQPLANTLGSIMSDEQINQLNAQIKQLLPDIKDNDISLYTKDSSVVGTLNDIKNMLENTSADAGALRRLFSGDMFKLMIKDALQQQWLIKPDDLARNPKKMDGLYEKIEQQLSRMEDIMKASGTQNSQASALAENIRGNVEFMNQVNEAYTYVQVPLKMNGQNASGQLYVYTNKKNIADPDRELSAFLHLDLDHLGSTDVSVKMLHKKVNTNFYLDSDESYALVKQFLPVLEKRLQDKGYNCELTVNNEAKHVNFVDGFLKKDMPSTGQVHRYSFDMRA